ncbi:MAG TPA: FKBP-type peptidyl-prolyl cis-trans isomerase [Bacteroidales bacterium]|nr:FKBP-type peptidyl-prolyl cis-trans isomerase [Bacteroidales bacterium]
MKQLLSLVVLAGIVLTSCNKPNYNAKLTNDIDSISYLLGLAYGKSFKQGGELPELNVQAYAKGINEGFNKGSLIISDQELNMKLNAYFMQLQKKLADKNLKAGDEFLAKNKTKKGVQTLPSGLQYEVVKEGTGPMPDSSSLVTTHYTLYHIDGKQIESTSKGEPAKFNVTQVIPGWTEALLKMRVGSKWKLYVPAKIGYGERGMGREIKPNETLIFDIELLNVEKAAPQPTPGMPKK